jgi:hypothetical protein
VTYFASNTEKWNDNISKKVDILKKSLKGKDTLTDQDFDTFVEIAHNWYRVKNCGAPVVANRSVYVKLTNAQFAYFRARVARFKAKYDTGIVSQSAFTAVKEYLLFNTRNYNRFVDIVTCLGV